MRPLLAVMLVLAIAVLSPQGRSAAQSGVNPSVFALTASDFPPGSQIVDSGVASNADVALRHMQIGPGAPAGRITGYYMQARSFSGAGNLQLVTSYLISLYPTAENADIAFNQQTDFWRGLLRSGAMERPLDAGAYGDPGREHWYVLSSASGDTHSELFFRRGSVFVELNLDSYGAGPGADAVDAFLAMGKKLDLVAGHPPTATRVPTATATATSRPTSTPRPTATSTPRPTSAPTLAAIKPVKETKPCQKGYKRVHGKCQKVKKAP